MNQGGLFSDVIQPRKLDSRIATSIVDGMRITNGWNIIFQRTVFSALHASTWREGSIYPQWLPELEEGDKFIQDTQCYCGA
ncbi:Uncharacterized protein FKW44_002186 [Caligus rogercresseyi]|uniref:Uncharacterized protein n=1 Tax=Caligus rogercresseyi TaxID=217165 RepID=A0A7T8QW42_CALRO|nr:Uncharacterized protein FKW44_002186 [Caligus rogercresseyi]